jgi:hypothetical protein
MVGLFGLLVAALVLVVLTRAVGDESLGFGATYTAGGTLIPKIEKLGVPNFTTNTVESKTLDLPNATIRKIAALKVGDSYNIVWQLHNATYQALETLRDGRTTSTHSIVIPIDTGTLSISVPGIIVSNKIEEIEAEKITVVTTTVEIAGKP